MSEVEALGKHLGEVIDLTLNSKISGREDKTIPLEVMYDWNVVDNTLVTLDQSVGVVGSVIEYDRKWDNSNNLGLGTEYRANDMFDIRGGLGWYEQVIPDQTFETQIPSAGRWFLTLGTGIHLGKTTIDLGYNAVFFRDRDINNDVGNGIGVDIDGKYETMVNIFYLGLKQKWGGEL